MKQNVGKILAVVLVVALCTVFFTACVPSDYTKAEANLKEAGYTVVSVDNTTDLGKLALTTEEASIKAIFDCEVNLIACVVGDKDDEGVNIYYCSSAEEAKALKKATKAYTDKYKNQLKEAKDKGDLTEDEYKEYMEDFDDAKYGSFGKVFWSGTKAGVKAAG